MSKHEYVRKLKKRLSCAYNVAEEFSKNANSGDKSRYDARAKATSLSVGDMVLVRNVSLRGTHKLADKWAGTPYIVVGQPNADIPVFEVKKDCSHARKTRSLPYKNKSQEKSPKYIILALRKNNEPPKHINERPTRDRKPPKWQLSVSGEYML